MSKKTKKVSYANLLKEALSDFTDVPKNVDTTGPFLDPILSYRGDGEIPTHKDAASILERYYFEQEHDKGVVVAVDEEESVVNKDIVTVGKDKAALPEEPEDVKSSKSDIEDAMAMEQEDMTDDDMEEEEPEEMEEQTEPAGLAGSEKELPPRKGADGEGQVEPADLKEDDSVESAVIEKLISEMEDEGDEDEDENKEEMKEQDEDKDEDEEELDVDKEMSPEEKEKKAEEMEDKAEDLEKEAEEEEEEEEMEEQTPLTKIAGAGGLDKEEMDQMYESFKIFKEQIEEEEVPNIDSKDVVV